jgi:hypothetical protein
MSKMFGVAAALAVVTVIGAASSAQAAVVPASVANIKSAVAPTVTSVQYRRWGGVGWRGPGWRGYGWRGGYGWRYPYRYGYGWGWGWPYYGAAIATGAVVGAAAAAPYYYPYYAPGYVAPAPIAGGPVRQCWVETDSRGYGYYQPC